jgi:hypothetical protein
MKSKFLNVAVALAVVGLSGCMNLKTTVQPSWHSISTHRVAVLPFKGESPYSETMSDFLITELVDRGFTVVERSELTKIMGEYSLQYTGGFDPSTLIGTGKLAGVDYLVIGSVSTREMIPVGEWLLGDGRKVTQVDNVHVRWVSVRNGQVVASSRIRNCRGGRMESIAQRIAESMDGAIRSVSAPKDEKYAAFTFSN